MTEYATITDISNRAHRSRGHTRQIIEAAGLTPNAKGQFPANEALAAVESAGSPDRQLGMQAAGRGAERTGAVSALAEARARAETARAHKLELQNLILENGLLDKSAVIRAGKIYSGHIRTGLIGFASAVAPRLVGKGADEIAGEIESNMRDLLARLGSSDDFVFNQLGI